MHVTGDIDRPDDRPADAAVLSVLGRGRETDNSLVRVVASEKQTRTPSISPRSYARTELSSLRSTT